MKQLHFAVIGQGHIGKRHSEMIRRHEQCNLVAVCDVVSKAELNLLDIKERFYNSINALLQHESAVDIVNICTPNGLHFEQALKALQANKHVVIEKPIALNTSDCYTLLALAKEKNKQIFCVMQNRYSPPSQWLKDIVSNKILGDIYMVQLNCYWNRDDRYYKPNNWKGTQTLDGGTLFTQFSHWVDILYWLFGNIKNIQAQFADFNHQQLTDFEDSGMIQFQFETGGMGTINYSTALKDKNLESSLTIIGSNGQVKVGGQYMDQVEICDIVNYTMPTLAQTNPANDYGFYKGSANNHFNVIENIVDVLTHNKSITTPAEDGLAVVNIIERIYKLRPASVLKHKN